MNGAGFPAFPTFPPCPTKTRPIKKNQNFSGLSDLSAVPNKDRKKQQRFHFALEFRFVLKAIVTRQATNDFAAFPILEDTAQVFAGYSSHGRQVALPNLVPNDDAVRSDLPPEMIRQFEERTGTRPRSDRKLPAATVTLVSRRRWVRSVISGNHGAIVIE